MERAKAFEVKCSTIWTHLLCSREQELAKLKNSNEWSVIRACAGLYPNIAQVDKKKKKLSTEIDSKLAIHMASVINNKNEKKLDYVENFPGDWILLEERNRIGRLPMIKCNTTSNSFCLAMTADAKVDVLKRDDEDDQALTWSAQ